ncbi:MAG: hypothetical protein K1X52_10990 [Pyrinomonadaceae bacterium]|nr:hypothetical protein [Pyrinomonadaceae bacterium]
MKKLFALAVFAAALFTVGQSSVFAQKELAISAIQGDGIASAYERQQVKTSGVVTARRRDGFFLQTPDGKDDKNPKTSEGIYVFTKDAPSADAAIGSLISITGQVQEFRPRAANGATLPITEISMFADRDKIQILEKSVPLPKPVEITAADFKDNSLTELEKYEGMRVIVPQLFVVAPTGGRVNNIENTTESNGSFFGVVKGMDKPFRGAGYDIFSYVFLSKSEKESFQKEHPGIKLFDGNPERLRIESLGLDGGTPIDVAAGTTLKDLTGVMHYSYNTYTILTDAGARPAVAGYESTVVKLPAATDRQFAVAGMNLENFFDDVDDPGIKEDIVKTDALKARMNKISLTVRDRMQMPDVIGVVEAENLAVLKRLAEKINSDAVTAGKPDPKYAAFLEEGNDGRGIDNGFLVKTSRVKAVEVKQYGKDEKFASPGSSSDIYLNDRPPLLLRASVADPKTGEPFAFTVIVNHLKSFLGYNDPKRQDAVRLKKRLQAEFLAKLVETRQKADPNERIILLGDFNAYQFSDGIVDVVGTIKGTPAAKDAVLNPSDDLVNPDLVNLVDLITEKQRYSYNFDGNGQVLDHMIVTANLVPYVSGFGFARVNADFPESFRSDASRPERYSDHDAAIGYFSLDAKKTTK